MPNLKERCNVEAARWIAEHPQPTADDVSSLLYSVIRPLEEDLAAYREHVRTEVPS